MAELSHIIATFGSSLARVAASYEADRALQEDLVQDILLAIHRSLPTLRDETKLAPFVFRIAHNRSVTHVMRQVSRRGTGTIDEVEEVAATPEDLLLATNAPAG